MNQTTVHVGMTKKMTYKILHEWKINNHESIKLLHDNEPISYAGDLHGGHCFWTNLYKNGAFQYSLASFNTENEATTFMDQRLKRKE